ncbi:MAG: peroxiredoxin [Verrucomicrobia bacterium]|nr:peroxiredoxin [Verrucomicrobiota bacterium]
MFPFSSKAGLLKVGDVAPDFTVAASDGSLVRLQEHIGKGPIVLYFYPKDDTPGCTKEACGIRDSFGEFKGLSATVFGVSFDTVESHKKFIAKYKLPFVLLADTDKKIATAYGAAGPRSLVPSRVTFIIGKDGRIARVFPKVSPAGHSAELRQALSELGR